MIKIDFSKISRLCLAVLVLIAFSCDNGDDPEPQPEPVADFSFEFDESNNLLVNFTSESANAEEYAWDFGDGTTSTEESPSHTFPNTGSFDVTLTVTSGDLSDEMTKTVTLESPGGVPTGANVVQGGNMSDPSAWTVMSGTEDGTVVDYEFTEDGVLYFSGDGEENTLHQLHVWQEVQLEADVEYLFYAYVSGGGFNNGYLEIDLGTMAPEENENYDPANVDAVKGVDPGSSKVVGINYWLGCGEEPFDGNIIEVGCDGPAQKPDQNDPEDESTNGRIQVATTGSYYLLIKAGNWSGSMGDGVSIDDILLAPIVED